jgi:hypothetical protein
LCGYQGQSRGCESKDSGGTHVAWWEDVDWFGLSELGCLNDREMRMSSGW